MKKTISTIKGSVVHRVNKNMIHEFYGDGILTVCGKHLMKENLSKKKKKRLCKLCFFNPKIKWIKKY